LAVGAAPGETVLDACAGRGNKTAILARAVGPCGAVDACDKSPQKLERLSGELGRLGLRTREVFAIDWTAGAGELGCKYDRVLVDAPCTGVGTIRRRPEIALRRGPEDLEAIARTQKDILSQAAARVRPGGTLLYVVCSVLAEECEAVVSAVLASHSDFQAVSFDAPELRALCGDDTSIRLLPHVHGTDGYFLARMRRKE
jgi:16S rRNA (cytosine967-C5)-methyltransferase